ncbi:uncharacterized protein BDZ99DRAFT_194094 [Mytilinidion resinicola]|uniref:Uncharacterized protein n=1 Tax=Mytilinidion resinicola TaxID=574789 RepID=A0A6A6Z4W6_9PEZI|nr:uncharacterized protein BDZ99DRAFT_194094 [Mytilinidion resinicola]KAF2815334.1 hypothetical protein BDZ99DRAFT_194094 [Mytilinidion resinicola]
MKRTREMKKSTSNHSSASSNSHSVVEPDDPPLPAELYANPAPSKTWKVSYIKKGLGIPEDVKFFEDPYVTICVEMEYLLGDIGVFGKTISKDLQPKVETALGDFHVRFPDIFVKIPDPWKTKCILALAHVCNNRGRRRGPETIAASPEFRMLHGGIYHSMA